MGYEYECLVTPDTSVIWALMSDKGCVWQGRRKRESIKSITYDDKHMNGPRNSPRTHEEGPDLHRYLQSVAGIRKGIFKGQLVGPSARDFLLWSGSQVHVGSPGEGIETCRPSCYGRQGWQTPRFPRFHHCCWYVG